MKKINKNLTVLLAILFANAFILTQIMSAQQENGLSNITNFLTNASFDSDFAGWTITATGAKISVAEKSDGLIPGNQNHIQFWIGSGGVNGKLEQTVRNLPDGKYKLSAAFSTTFTGDVYLYANECKTSVISESNRYYEVVCNVVDGTLTLGVEMATTGSPVIDIDDFNLYIYGDAPEYDRSWTTVKNGQLWADNSGRFVQAHAAGFLQVGDTWYMIGEDRSGPWNPDVNMYSSKDLVNWKFERKIIQNGVTHPQLGNGRFIERPKLMYNEKTDKFVVWCHWEQGNYGASEAAVFYCDSVNGPYTFHWAGRPLGIKSRDCNVFVDDDGTGYFISTTNENRDLGLFKLSDDYLSVVEHTALFTGQAREAPAIVRIGDTYFMISSACTGWDPNQAKISYSKSLKSGWSSNNNLGNPISFDTQAASILKIEGSEGVSYVYVGDRWNDPQVGSTSFLRESKTIMFPIEFHGNSCKFNYRQQFDIDFETGKWRDTPVAGKRVPKGNWKLRNFSSQEGSTYSALKTIDGNNDTYWHSQYSGTVAWAPHYIEVDMGEVYEDINGFLVMPRLDNASVNGLIHEYVMLFSVDGKEWETVSGAQRMPYGAEIYISPTKARYFRLEILSAHGGHGSISEIDILTDKGVSFEGKVIRPMARVNGKLAMMNTLEVEVGDRVELSPSVVGTFVGTWALYENGKVTTSTNQPGSIVIEDISKEQEGVYSWMYLDARTNEASSCQFNIIVNPVSDVKSTAYAGEVLKKEFYSLLGTRLNYQPKNGAYLVKNYYSNGQSEFVKTIYSRN